MTNGFDKLLRESLAAEADGHGADCPDAAIVAGWFDGTLSHAERTAVETHAATCARCQATIAALVRTDRPAPRAWWRAPAMQWLLPAAVAAGASLIVWIGVLRTDEDAVPPPAETSARLESSARTTAAAEPAASSAGQAGAAGAAAKAAPVPDAEARGKADQRLQRARVPAATTLSADETKVQAPAAETLTPEASVAAPPQQALESARRADVPSSPPAAMAGASEVPASTSARSSTEPANVADAARYLAERTSVQSVAAAAGRGGGRAPLIQSADRSVRWRITGQTQVERSADGGVTWQAQTTGVNAVLVAGVAPSSTVCWLVGWRGVVLKTTDGGQTWTRVAFPEEINLVGVVADDEKVATVTAAGGRQLHTTDGGNTWR